MYRVPERGLLADALRALAATTGAHATIVHEELPALRRRYDAVVEIQLWNRKLRYLVEVKQLDRIAAIGHIKAQLAAEQTAFRGHEPMLVAPYLTRELAQECRAINLAFLDLAGNAYLHVPGVFIFVVGQPRPEQTESVAYQAATATGSRLTIALLCDPALASQTYRKISSVTGVALGAIGPVFKDLEQRRLLRRFRNGPPRLTDGPRLLDEWLAHFPATLRPKLHPRRYHADPERLLQLDPAKYNAYWGGEVAAARLTGNLKPEHFTIYMRGRATQLLTDFRMRLDARGNTEVLDAYWPETADKPGASDAPPLVVYADLVLTGESRNLENARQIYEQQIEPALSSR